MTLLRLFLPARKRGFHQNVTWGNEFSNPLINAKEKKKGGNCRTCSESKEKK